MGADLRLFDFRRLEHLGVEARLEQLARWVVDAETHGERYGLIIPPHEVEPGSGPQHRHECLTALATYGVHAPFRNHIGAAVVLLSTAVAVNSLLMVVSRSWGWFAGRRGPTAPYSANAPPAPEPYTAAFTSCRSASTERSNTVARGVVRTFAPDRKRSSTSSTV